MVPHWLHVLSILSVLLAIGCAIVVAVDVVRHPQHMWIMNVVWPVTALFGTVLGLWGYFRYGRLATHERAQAAMARDEEMPSERLDAVPGDGRQGRVALRQRLHAGRHLRRVAGLLRARRRVWLGWHWLFGEKMFAVWVLDFIFAFGFGIAFQYFTIQPMRHLSVRRRA